MYEVFYHITGETYTKFDSAEAAWKWIMSQIDPGDWDVREANDLFGAKYYEDPY